MKKLISNILVLALICNFGVVFAVDSTNGSIKKEDIIGASISSRYDILQYADVDVNQIIERKDSAGGVMYIAPTGNYETVYNEVTVADFTASIMNDPTVSNVKFDGTTVTYEFNGQVCYAREFLNNEGLRSIELIEGEDRSVITFNSAEKEILLDNKPVEIGVQDALVFSKNQSRASDDDWYYYHTSYPDIKAEEQIRNIAPSALLILLSAGLNPVVGVSISLATLLVSAYANASSASTVVYVKRTSYRDYGYWTWKYVDEFYTDSSYSNLIKSVENIVYY